MGDIGSYSHWRDLFRRHRAAFDRSSTFRAFASDIGRDDLLDKWGDGWVAKLFTTDKMHGIGTLYRPLEIPLATSLHDLFSSAELTTSGDYRGKIYCGGKASFSGHLGGDRYVRRFPDGSAVRGHSRSTWTITVVEPTKLVLDAWRSTMGDPTGEFGISSFELIQHADTGKVLVVGGTRYFSSVWLAYLPACSIRELLSNEEIERIADEENADAIAWSCVYRGADGRDYVDEARAAEVGTEIKD